MGEEHARTPVWAGVDTHKDFHVLCVLDAAGAVVARGSFPESPDGHARMARAIGDPSRCALVSVEGCGSYGARAADALEAAGFAVAEACRPLREGRGGGKSDDIDAERAARRGMAGRCAPRKRAGGDLDELSLLFARREMLMRQKTAWANHVHGELARAPQEVGSRFAGLSGAALMGKLAALRPRAGSGHSAWLVQLREAARTWSGLAGAADAAEASMRALVERGWPRMLAADGMDVLTAVPLILLGGANPGRFGSDAAFSKACGASPLPCGSGKTSGRHRLNRGGDRKANRSLTTIARNRMQHDPRTRAYVERRLAEGKTERDVERCLKRFVAREVYKILLDPSLPEHPGGSLRAARRSLGMTQAEVAGLLGTTTSKLSLYENGRRRYLWLEEAYTDLMRVLCEPRGDCSENLEKGSLQT